MANINIPLDPALHRRLRVVAAELDLKVHEAVTLAIEEWVTKHEAARGGERS